MKPYLQILLLFITACNGNKERLIGQQAAIRQKMDSVDAWKGATYMLVHEWRGEKKYDSVRRTGDGRAYFVGLQRDYERYDSVYREYRRQYDLLETKIQKQ